MRININLDKNPSKAEEIATLEKLQGYFRAHGNNYLASLFSDKLIGEVSNHIKNDFPPDVMEYRETLFEEITKIKDERKKAEKELNDYRSEAESDFFNITLELSKTAKELKRQKVIVDCRQKQVDRTWKQYCDALELNRCHERKIKDLEREITIQKCKFAGLIK